MHIFHGLNIGLMMARPDDLKRKPGKAKELRREGVSSKRRLLFDFLYFAW